MHGERLCDGEVDPVSERRDHQPTVQTHVLVAILEHTCEQETNVSSSI